MTGFETYSPLKWLVEGALAVHVVQPIERAVKNVAVRSGRWAARGMLSTTVALASVLSSTAALANLPTGTVDSARPVQMILDLMATDDAHEERPQLAPEGYSDRVVKLLRQAPLLPAEALETDPEFLF